MKLVGHREGWFEQLFRKVALTCPRNGASSPEAPAVKDLSQVDTSVSFSVESGAYDDDPLELILTNPSGLPIVYTTDGSLPTASSTRAPSVLVLRALDTNGAFIKRLAREIPDRRTIVFDGTLPTATVVRAAVLLPDATVGPAYTNTYFVGEDLGQVFGDVLVVSLVADPYDLLDYDTGIMAKGAVYRRHRAANRALANHNQYLVQANYSQKGRDWERPATLELFDCSNALSREVPCGIRLRGYMSRVYAQKSFNVYFRGSYGMKVLDYPLFGDDLLDYDGKPLTKYRSFCLRSGGNGTELLRFRDSLFASLASSYDVGTQAMRPAIVFLNGEFYGVYSLIEKLSDSYIQSHYGVGKDNVVMFKEGVLDEGVDGDQVLYDELMSFARRDLADEATWKEFCEVVDVQSMVDCHALNLYIGNIDFGDTKNCRIWRARSPEEGIACGDGRWRWLAFDLEFSAGLYGLDWMDASFDSVARYLKTSQLFVAAMRNAEFRSMMRERLEDLSQSAFRSDYMDAQLETWWDTWEPWMRLSCRRFSLSIETAEMDRQAVSTFFSERAEHILASFDEHALELA